MANSTNLFARAQTVIPGGVNSPVRAFKGVGGTPVFFKSGQGPYLLDVDNRQYIDFVGSWGPLILGHAHPSVVKAIQQAATKGLSFGAPTELEVEMAETLSRLVPSLEQVRMVNSGTEATQSAIRLARGYTGRHKVLKFDGGYHGHSDGLLVKSGSGLLTLGIPGSPGVPKAFTELTLTAPFNDSAAVSTLFEAFGNDIAAVIVEPVACNMNCVLPAPHFLENLRKICDQYNSLLIFDEVITGFRVALGGAQAYYQVKPDLTCLGKIIGGGLPVGAFGGKREIMQKLAPVGPVYQAGTLSGNPIALTAGLTTLTLLQQPLFYETLTEKTASFMQNLTALAREYQIPFHTNTIGGLFGLFFTKSTAITHCDDVAACDIALFKKFFHEMLKEGIYFAPSAFEAGFMSSAHTDSVIDQTLSAAQKVFRRLMKI